MHASSLSSALTSPPRLPGIVTQMPENFMLISYVINPLSVPKGACNMAVATEVYLSHDGTRARWNRHYRREDEARNFNDFVCWIYELYRWRNMRPWPVFLSHLHHQQALRLGRALSYNSVNRKLFSASLFSDVSALITPLEDASRLAARQRARALATCETEFIARLTLDLALDILGIGPPWPHAEEEAAVIAFPARPVQERLFY